MSGKTRVQLELTQSMTELLDSLKSRLEARSRAEVVRRALKLLDDVSQNRVVIRKEDGTEMVLSVF